MAALLSSIAMLWVLALPIWQIQLTAPQYPEGLRLQIFASRIGGDVDVVNGLNHYIGMHTLHTRDFVEFVVLPYIIGGFAALGVLVTLINRKAVFYGWFALFLLIAFISMLDFYRWEYNYGHNLDPAAPIQVPGMAYQPPLLGYKQLLNFGAYSIPDSGGWVFVSVGIVLAAAFIRDIRGRRRMQQENRQKQQRNPRHVSVKASAFLVAGAVLTLQSCHSGAQPIRYGQDNCDFCKMTIMDNRFGGEITTKKGKVYKYDDMHCLLSACRAGIPAKNEIAAIYLTNFSDGQWILAADSYLLQNEAFHTPMNGNIAAFSSVNDRTHYQQEIQGQALSWKELYQ